MQSCSDALHFNDLVSQIEQLNGLKRLIINYADDESDSDFQNIPMLTGYLKCPKDWKIVNPEDAKESLCAYVMECMNGSKFGIPHYVFFDNLQEIDDNFTNKVIREILSVYPDFQRVINMQVELMYEKDKPQTLGYALNLDEWGASPVIGIFRIKTTAEIKTRREFDPHYNPPANAEVVM